MAALEKRKGIDEIDATILRYADTRSLEQISELLDGVLTPEAVGARAQTLYKSTDWLTAAQKDQAILERMHALLEEIEQYFQDEKMLKLRLDTLKAIADRIDRRKAATESDLNTYDQNIGRMLGAVVDGALSYMKGALRGQVDPEEWDQLVRDAMINAQVEIAKHQVESPI